MAYAATKAGLTGFTRQIAAEYAKDNIRANAIAPGWHGGTRLADHFKSDWGPDYRERFEAEIVAARRWAGAASRKNCRGL